MALGSANQQPHNYQRVQPQNMLTTRALYQHNQQRPIAPAPAAAGSRGSCGTAPYQTKARISPNSVYAAGTTLDSNNPAVVRRNARERNRVKQVNNGFLHLRQHLPTAIVADLSNGRRGIGPGANKKLSKVDTLRMAVEYIRRLKNVIEEVDSGSETSSVRSFNGSAGSCASSSSGSDSPPPTPTPQQSQQSQKQQQQQQQLLQQQQQFYPLSYAGGFQQQQQQLISPAGSTNSSNYSSSHSYYEHSPLTLLAQQPSQPAAGADAAAAVQLKFEQCYDEYGGSASAGDDDEDEILDYISLWQDEL